jgi:hypothetical protein
MEASLLTQRSLKVYAVLQSYQDGTGDLIEALSLFFEPFIRERHGKPFSADQLANAVNQEYRWRMTSAVVESFVERFAKKGWLERVAESDSGILWRYSLEPSSAETPHQASITELMELVQSELAAFVDKIHPLKFQPRTPEVLFDALIRWLVYIDGYSADILRIKSAHASMDSDGKLSLYERLPDDSNVTPEEKYLSARFTQHVMKEDGQLASALARLASIGLLTEVIQDFRHPTSAAQKTNLRIYLDAPVALEYTGFSGVAAQSHTKFLIDHLRSLGAEIRIFRDSVDEMHRVLSGMLRRPKADREGATADALRRGEILEEVVIQAARDPAAVARRANIDVIERNLSMFPYQAKHFDQKMYDDFYGRITWHYESKPKAHDAAVTAMVVREREGKRSSDIFESGAILLTKSHWLSQLVRSFCVDKGIIGSDQVSPVIQLKQMAAFAWLRTGLATEREEVPRKFVMAACERVLELRPNVISQFAALARKLAPENAEQYEMLVMMDRGAQALMDKTLGSLKSIEPDNFDETLAAIEMGVANKVRKQADDEISAIQAESRASLAAAEDARARTEEIAQAALQTLETVSRDERAALRAMFRVVNRRIRNRRRVVSSGIYLTVAALFTLTITSGLLTGVAQFVGVAILALLVAWLAWLQLTERANIVDNYLRRVREQLIEEEANERDLIGALDRWPDEWQQVED